MTKEKIFVEELKQLIINYEENDIPVELLCRILYKHNLITKDNRNWVFEYDDKKEKNNE